MIRLVVFDMAGTTVRDDDGVNRCLGQALARAGVEASRDAINAVMGLRKPDAIDALLGPDAADAARVARRARIDAIHRDFAEAMIAHYRSAPEVAEVAGTSAVFRTLKSWGIRIALDTGFDRRIANAVLRRFRWIAEGLVDATVTSDEVPRGRPAPDMVFRAMTLTGVGDATGVAKVGDTPSDLHEGTQAGCRLVVGVTSGTHTRSQLATAPHTHLVDTLTELIDIVARAGRPNVRTLR